MLTRCRLYLLGVLAIVFALGLALAPAGSAHAQAFQRVTGSAAQQMPVASYGSTSGQGYQLAVQKVLARTGSTDPGAVHPSIQTSCRTIVFRSRSGGICVTVYLACAGPVCAPYQVDVDFTQQLLNIVETYGTVLVPVIVSAIVAVFPALQPVQGVITSVLNAIVTLLPKYSRDVCGGHGAGVTFGLTSPVPSLHCY